MTGIGSTPPPTVLFLQQDCHIGGAEISQANLIHALDTTRYHAIVVLPNEDPQWSILAGVEVWTARIEYFKRTLSPFSWFAYLWNLLRTTSILMTRIRKSSHDVDIVHTGSLSAQLHATLLRKRNDRFVVWHVRDIIKQDYFGRLLMRICAEGADRVIAISSAVEASLQEAGVPSWKCQIIPNAVDTHLFDAGIVSRRKFREELNLADDTLLIVHLGKFIPEKGQDILIKAIPLVAAEIPNVHFVLIGGAVLTGKDHTIELMRLRSDLDLADKLTILDYRQDVREVIAAADIVVNSSHVAEAFGRTLIEAMALQKPVVGPNHGGVPEIIIDGETGLLFTRHSYQHLASALLRLLSSRDDMQAMGNAGRERVEQFYSLPAHAARVQSVYDELLKNKG